MSAQEGQTIRRPRHGVKVAMLAAVAAGLLVPGVAGAATADLSVTKSDNADPVAEGAELTYTITVSSSGPDAVSGVEVTDNLPAHTDFISVTTTTGACEQSGNRVTCELGTVAAQGNSPAATITIKVRPTRAGTLENTATVSVAPQDDDPVSGNNSDTETTQVTAAPSGPSCAGETATAVGTGGADTIIGTDRRDVIVARGGNDVVRGVGQNDIVCAGGGNDLVKGGTGNDLLKGGRGRDRLRGGAGSDELRGGGGNDSCRGGAGADTERSC